MLGSLQNEKLRYCKIIWALTRDSEKFIHERAKYITIP